MKLLCATILSIMAVVSAIQYIDCGKLSLIAVAVMLSCAVASSLIRNPHYCCNDIPIT